MTSRTECKAEDVAGVAEATLVEEAVVVVLGTMAIMDITAMLTSGSISLSALKM